MSLSRRNFLQLGAAAIASPYILRAAEPNGRLQIGSIGVGPRGRANTFQFAGLGDIVALADLDEKYGIAPTLQNKTISERKVDTYSDYRRILDRKDIDLVSISTPDHWHIKIAVEALQAGKHVYCEKPLTLTVEEGQLIRKAHEKYPKQVFQVGSMQRSHRLFMTAVLLAQKGFLGKIDRLTCQIDGGLVSGPIPKTAPPSTLDWDTWLGQAPVRDYIETAEIFERFGCPLHTRGHHEFRWFFDYAGGKFTDWGAHHADIALWALPPGEFEQGHIKINPVVAEHPIPLKDGEPTIDDQYQTATKFKVECTLASGTVIELASHSKYPNGLNLHGSKAEIHVSRGRITGDIYEKDKVQDTLTDDDYTALNKGKKWQGQRGDQNKNDISAIVHKKNMLTCITEGGEPASDIDSHLKELNLCHVACLATRLGRELVWDPKNETFIGDAHANTFLARERRKGFDILL
ncbi:NADH-dependent dehydrogenase [Planctomycetales bacterium]|nr:NADH-dependent dehydrogenase [Planctomycetales bacterium]